MKKKTLKIKKQKKLKLIKSKQKNTFSQKKKLMFYKYKKKRYLQQYGNYKQYYKTRNEKGKTDPRIQLLKKNWFEGKQCLDIGCNSGSVTFDIGKKKIIL